MALLCRVFEINHERRVTVLINVGISNSVSYSLVCLLQKGKKLLVKISLYHKKVREHPTGNVCGECQITKIYSHQILVDWWKHAITWNLLAIDLSHPDEAKVDSSFQ